jgi:diacylglycerol kinase family enzyme
VTSARGRSGPISYDARDARRGRAAIARRGRAVRLLLVVNSFASSVTARNRVLIEQALSQVAAVEVRETNRRGHATRFAHDATLRGIDVVAALGGDGTLNEVVNGLAGTDTMLAVLPGGSTNVFARTIGEPNDPVTATRLVAEALAAGHHRRIGLGRVNGRYFTFHTGIGFDAAVVAEVEKRGSAKRWLGHPLFAYAGLKTWLVGYDRKRPHFSVRYPDGTELTDGYFTLVLNTNPYTYLGNRPFDLTPDAGLDHPLVAVTFRSLGAAVMLRNIARTLTTGGVSPNRSLDLRTRLPSLVVESDRPFPYQVDGDHLGDTRRLVFQDAPDCLTLVAPAPAPAPAPAGA